MLPQKMDSFATQNNVPGGSGKCPSAVLIPRGSHSRSSSKINTVPIQFSSKPAVGLRSGKPLEVWKIFARRFRPIIYGIVPLHGRGGEDIPGSELKQVEPLLQEEQI